MQDELGQNAVTGVVSVAASEDGEEGVSIHFEACACIFTAVCLADVIQMYEPNRMPVAGLCGGRAAVSVASSVHC